MPAELRVTRIAIAAAAALVVAGCGSHDKTATSGYPSVCEIAAETGAEAAVVKRAYDEGKLGTATELARYFENIPKSAYLKTDGTMRPFAELKGDARIAFEGWMNGTVAGMKNDVGDAVRAALARVRRSSIATGKPCKQVILK